MHFCSNCSNMYYIRINSDDPNKLVYYCRKCGNEDKLLAIENVCVSKTQIKKSIIASTSDPTSQAAVTTIATSTNTTSSSISTKNIPIIHNFIATSLHNPRRTGTCESRV